MQARATCETKAAVRPGAAAAARAAPQAAPQPAQPKAAQVAAALAMSAVLLTSGPAMADLNRREADVYGMFDRGSAKQFGSMTMNGQDIIKGYGKDLGLSNFTSTEMRNVNLDGANLKGAYLIKSVAPGASFKGADLSDALMDRAIFVDANFENAILVRVVLTLSDLKGAKIENADFSEALIDKKQQEMLCKYASGKNPVTGADTRKSLNCGGRLRGSPSSYMSEDGVEKPKASFSPDNFSQFN